MQRPSLRSCCALRSRRGTQPWTGEIWRHPRRRLLRNRSTTQLITRHRELLQGSLSEMANGRTGRAPIPMTPTATSPRATGAKKLPRTLWSCRLQQKRRRSESRHDPFPMYEDSRFEKRFELSTLRDSGSDFSVRLYRERCPSRGRSCHLGHSFS